MNTRQRIQLPEAGIRSLFYRFASLGFLLCLLMAIACLVAPKTGLAGSASDPAASTDQPAKLRQLLDLLADPGVQTWLKQQKAPPVAVSISATSDSVIEYAAGRLEAIREHLGALVVALPMLPEELGRAAGNLAAEAEGPGALSIILMFGVLVAVGVGAERLFLRATRSLGRWIQDLPLDTVGQRLSAAGARLGLGVAILAAFSIGSIGTFLAFNWPPLLRDIVLGYLLALLALRAWLILSRFLLTPNAGSGSSSERHRILPMDAPAVHFWHLRLAILVGWFAFGWATVELLSLLGFDPNARSLVAYILGLGLLSVGLESVWHRPLRDAAGSQQALRRRAVSWLVSAYFGYLWLLWVASAIPLFWLSVILVVVPWAMSGTQRAVANLLQPTTGNASPAAVPTVYVICLQRGLRAAIMIAGAFALAHAWHIDLVALTSSDTVITRLLRGLLSAVVIVLLADFGWQLMKTAIDRKIAATPDTSDHNSQEWRRHARLQTLLPICRNLLFVLLLVTAVLMGLAALGVEIGPLIAGASVVGVAIGFGSQTLVKDIIAGMFYLLDDAFRVGEYIQSGNYKGTVESFSLRSVKLRHHRGPLFTVPFGVLGAVENMSRDWVIDKLAIGVTYDTDLTKVRQIIKRIGKALKDDPEFGPKILEPLKMQGVEQFGDFAIQIRMKMMTLPNENFVIRRRANAMIKEAFDTNGIKFAFPTVQVAGGTDRVAAGSAYQSLKKQAIQE